MRDEHSKWWEDQLLPPEDLTPLSQTLISPHLALAFDIPTHHHHHHSSPPPPPPLHHPNSGDFDSSSTGADEPARTLKRPRLVWTPQLHKRFVDAVAHLGIKNAVPKTIMQLMSVDGLTRENVASHLQKYRLYLKRMQGVGVSGGDPASDRLFASSPVPAHFLNPQFVTSPPGYPAIHHQHQHQQQVAAMVAGGGGYHQHHHGRQMGHFAFENSYMTRQVHAMNQNLGSGYADDFESGTVGNGRRVLTLFPTAD